MFPGINVSFTSGTFANDSDFLDVSSIHFDPTHKQILLEQMELRGIGSKHPQIHNQPIEPNTKILIPCNQTNKCKEPTESVEGQIAVTGANKEGKMREPVALPPLKKIRIQTNATIDPHASFQTNVNG